MNDNSQRLYDEFARLFTDAASVAQGVKREAEGLFRTQADRFIANLDLVRREDFEVVRDMASRARAENEALAARIAALEEKLADGGGASRTRREPRSGGKGGAQLGDDEPMPGSTGT